MHAEWRDSDLNCLWLKSPSSAHFLKDCNHVNTTSGAQRLRVMASWSVHPARCSAAQRPSSESPPSEPPVKPAPGVPGQLWKGNPHPRPRLSHPAPLL